MLPEISSHLPDAIYRLDRIGINAMASVFHRELNVVFLWGSSFLFWMPLSALWGIYVN